MSLSRPQVGARVVVRRTIIDEDIEAFARLSLDRNPLHFDEAFARRTFFGRRIAHGMLGAALISGALTELMGEGNVWLGASVSFKNPILPGETLECHLEVVEVNRRGVADISVLIRNERGEPVITGTVQSMRFAVGRSDGQS